MGDRGGAAVRLVADADVLAADLFVGGPARDALDHVRSHSWLTLVASEHLLEETRALVATLADDTLAADWREAIGETAVNVQHEPGDQPALAAAHRGNAAHVLSFDPTLTSASAAAALRTARMSVKTPSAFVRLFDPADLYPTLFGEPYPGPDRHPRGGP